MNSDFASDVRPLLDQLQDDPIYPPDWLAREDSTTFPIESDHLEGRLAPLSDADGSLDPGVGSNSDLNDEDVEAAGEAFPMGGIDVLAFYKSFRFVDRSPFPGHWGAFLFDVGIEALARHLAANGLVSPRHEVRQLAADVLLAHERYHFWIDAWTLNQEVLPFVTQTWKKRYVYYRSRAKSVAGTEFDFEESLANHYAFKRLRDRRLSDGHAVRTALRRVLRMQPGSYSQFEFDPTQRVEIEGHLARAAANGFSVLDSVTRHGWKRADGCWMPTLQPPSLGGAIHPPDPRHPVVGSHRCPAYLASCPRYARLITPFLAPKLGELKSFVVNYLGGQELPRTDHANYRIDNGQKLRFPNDHNKDALRHELKGTLRKAGMTPKDFVDERIRTDFWNKGCPRTPPKPPFGPG